ncbi:hypothetical protein [Neobacillus drentensis]|uniref:hypothetical protein n=1 Tax=Neobacillus drentensis TaxID=220684 RepID=UPI003B5898F8
MINYPEITKIISVTTTPGCLLQMQLGIEREGLSGKMRGDHIEDLLAEAVK